MMRYIGSFLFSILLIGCVSQIAPFKDHLKSWVGASIDEYIEVKKLPHMSRTDYVGQERVTKLDNGNMIYEFPYPKCPAFFEVNYSGVIVAAYSENDQDCY